MAFLTFLSLFLSLAATYPRMVVIDYCGDCPEFGYCNSNYKCTTDPNGYSRYSNVVKTIFGSCNFDCPFDCCINGDCGSYEQCYPKKINSCKYDCEYKCCNGDYCGTEAYCKAQTQTNNGDSGGSDGVWITILVVLIVMALIFVVRYWYIKKNKNNNNNNNPDALVLDPQNGAGIIYDPNPSGAYNYQQQTSYQQMIAQNGR